MLWLKGRQKFLHSTSGAQVVFFPRRWYCTNGKKKEKKKKKKKKKWEEYSDT